MFVRPQRDAVKIVHVAVAIGSKDSHVAGRVSKSLLKYGTFFGASLCKTRCETNCAGCTSRFQVTDNLKRRLGRCCDEACVRHPWQVGHAGEAGDPGKFLSTWIYGPDIAVKADGLALAYYLGGAVATKYRHSPR